MLLALAGARLFSPRVGIAAGLMLALYAPAIFFDGLLQKSVARRVLRLPGAVADSRTMNAEHAEHAEHFSASTNDAQHDEPEKKTFSAGSAGSAFSLSSGSVSRWAGSP